MKKLINIGYVVIVLAILFLTLGFINKTHKQSRCKDIDIQIYVKDGNYFINHQDVLQIVNHQGRSVLLGPLSDINAMEIERLLEENRFVDRAEVFVTLDGILKVNVFQRTPTIRVFPLEGKSYYLDDKARALPLNEHFSSKVVLLTGSFPMSYSEMMQIEISADTSEKYEKAENILNLAFYIAKDKFWKAWVDQIFIRPDHTIELITLAKDQVVYFGKPENIEDKLSNLHEFYKQELNVNGWQKYHEIDISFKNQIICKKTIN